MTALELARKLKYVRELQGNTGQRVEAIQKWGGGKAGDSWCAFFVTMVLDIVYEGKCPLPRTGSCDVILQRAHAEHWIVAAPEPGDLYLRLNSPTDAHHVGFCTTELYDNADGQRVFGQISGNTSADGLSSNGDGVYEREVRFTSPDKIVFVHVPAAA